MEIGERVKFIRKNAGLTQQAFGDRIGLKRNSVATIEGGRPTSDQVIKSISREFCVNEAWLRTGEGDPYSTTVTREQEIAAMVRKNVSGSPEFADRLISVLSRLDESEWVLLERLAQALLAENTPSGPSNVVPIAARGGGVSEVPAKAADDAAAHFVATEDDTL